MRLISAASSSRRFTPPLHTGAPPASKPTRNVPCGGAKSAGVALGMTGTSIATYRTASCSASRETAAAAGGGGALGMPGASIAPYRTAISATIAETRSVAGGASAGPGWKRSIGAIVAHPMPRDGTHVFLTGDATAVPVATDAEPEQRRGFFRRLRENLSKTRQALGAEI